MKRTNVLRTSGLAVAALTLSAGLAACGSDEEPTPETGTDNSSEMEETPMEEPEETEEGGMDPAANLYGDACSEVPTSGDGSVEGMATAPVASAASANPLLETLVAAVTAADLVEPLNSAPELTVFAPFNGAFDAFTKKQLNGLLADKDQLTQVLTHHVVPQSITPDQLEGEFETLNGDTLTINGSGQEATIGDEEATVLCGGVVTANATVYIIDTVMMP